MVHQATNHHRGGWPRASPEHLVISEFEKGPLRRLIATKELLVREVLGRINVQDPREGLVRFLCATQGFCGRLRENAREKGELA